jgi:hypothetical protein
VLPVAGEAPAVAQWRLEGAARRQAAVCAELEAGRRLPGDLRRGSGRRGRACVRAVVRVCGCCGPGRVPAAEVGVELGAGRAALAAGRPALLGQAARRGPPGRGCLRPWPAPRRTTCAPGSAASAPSRWLGPPCARWSGRAGLQAGGGEVQAPSWLTSVSVDRRGGPPQAWAQAWASWAWPRLQVQSTPRPHILQRRAGPVHIAGFHQGKQPMLLPGGRCRRRCRCHCCRRRRRRPHLSTPRRCPGTASCRRRSGGRTAGLQDCRRRSRGSRPRCLLPSLALACTQWAQQGAQRRGWGAQGGQPPGEPTLREGVRVVRVLRHHLEGVEVHLGVRRVAARPREAQQQQHDGSQRQHNLRRRAHAAVRGAAPNP